MSRQAQVAVVGAGVCGLSAAHEIAKDAQVTVLYDRPLLASTSAIATAIWHVYLVDPSDEVHLDWSARTMLRLVEIHDAYPEAGLELTPGVELYNRGVAETPTWAHIAIDFEMLSDDDRERLYPGRGWGYNITAPTANMDRYLPWLARACRQRGVRFSRQTVTALDELLEQFDLVVNCAGLRASDLCDDDEMYPVRGQYLVVQQPPELPTFYIGDDQHPDGMAYLIPRGGEVILGGTEEHGIGEDVFTERHDELIRRATDFVDIDLSGCPVHREVTGIRPVRSSGQVRFGPDPDQPRVLHNYGHGGSGFSLAWGCAQDLVELVRLATAA